MTPGRFILLLAVIVAVLFGVSLALTRNTSDNPVGPDRSWVGRLAEPLEKKQQVDPARDLRSDCLQGKRLIVPKSLKQCRIEVRPYQSLLQQVRKTQLQLRGSDSFRVEYLPSPKEKRGVKVKVDEYKPEDKPLQLMFMENGGTLVLTRLSALGDSSFEIH